MANTTTITGNLTREPEIRYTREGQATAQLGVAVNRRWRDRLPRNGRSRRPSSTSSVARSGGERRAEPDQGHAGCRDRPAGAPDLGDRGGGASVQGGDHRRREEGAACGSPRRRVHKVERRGSVTRRTPRPSRWRWRPEVPPWLITTSGGRADGAFRRSDGTPRGGSGTGGRCGGGSSPGRRGAAVLLRGRARGRATRGAVAAVELRPAEARADARVARRPRLPSPWAGR